jgi:hypothetical protein
MRERPLALTDSQMALLKRHAAALPEGKRDAFVREVMRRLGEGPPATPALEAAINLVHGVAPQFEEEMS